jgi:hypothetical protein
MVENAETALEEALQATTLAITSDNMDLGTGTVSEQSTGMDEDVGVLLLGRHLGHFVV